MFRHKGKGRTYSHNLKLASILSFVAGTVNITGVLALGTLTTNVTGHFAFFSEELFFKNIEMAFVSLVYILFFLTGAFVSGLLIELVSKSKYYLAYILPISIEIIVLTACSFLYLLFPNSIFNYSILLSCLLLFSMGIQNALVTRISNSVVRTTHLTGLFTDLGIELSQIITKKVITEKNKIKRDIQLKLIIIFCFFCGGIIGGFLYTRFKLATLLFPTILLLFALWYDRLLFRFYYFKRKHRH
ncbi:Uncharacterized membrane protein YoaK, UPF0700 family [Paenimyroides aquimaris]|uniref:Uncharacterized membrane protein YoaK, UPF0700 family n=1 Tax=Paenimyroides marinum TaxID=1159016 RepID=A0A1H6IZR6_9FLAO|nr:YoaK family protein [Paenimyroides aquimaris]SEH55191.1 Uncharacterized membrane protein YoaK, UPF0700 family [Paenimyroides aquimaris]